MRINLLTAIGLGAAMALHAGPVHAVINCPGTITADYTASDDLQETANATCVTINGTGITLNLANHSIICNNAGGCLYGVSISNSSTNATVKNGSIIPGTNVWTDGVFNGVSSGSAVTTTVSMMTIDVPNIGVTNPYKVLNCIFKDVVYCVLSITGKATNGLISQNYCNSATDGFDVNGGTTAGTAPTISRNYVTAPNGNAILTDSNFATVKDNVACSGTITTGANTTVTENLCDDTGVCPEPSSNFSMNLGFTP